jgi:hypothetical protein
VYWITKDTYIDSDSVGGRDYNYGANNRLRAVANAGVESGASRTRILLGLDIPAEIWSLPVSQIEYAKLYLYCYGQSEGDGRPISLYPLLTPFVEGSGTGSPDVSGATWGTSDGSVAWTPGGEYDSSIYVDGVAGGQYAWWTWDLKALWGNADLAANGALLAVSPETGVPSQYTHISGTFRSSDYSDELLRPYVEVNVVPEPATCVLFLTAGVLMSGGALLRRRHRRARLETESSCS